jgi:regulator of protease activity HflC (stomatin/prohibitin superfamily)
MPPERQSSFFPTRARSLFGVFFPSASHPRVPLRLHLARDAEFGLAYDWHTKKLADEAMLGGLHAGPPGFKFIKFPSTYRSFEIDNQTCVSRDGLRVLFSATFQFQLPQEWVKPVVMKYASYKRWHEVVVAAGRSAVQHTCSLYEVQSFSSSRGAIQGAMEEKLREKLEGPLLDGDGGVYARAISLQLSNVQLPQEYRDAVTEKQQASEDITLAVNQRTQETTMANTELLQAKEEAKKILDAAENEANVLKTEAELRKEGIDYAYAQDAAVYTALIETATGTGLEFSANDVVAFITNRLLEETPGYVKASLHKAETTVDPLD